MGSPCSHLSSRSPSSDLSEVKGVRGRKERGGGGGGILMRWNRPKKRRRDRIFLVLSLSLFLLLRFFTMPLKRQERSTHEYAQGKNQFSPPNVTCEISMGFSVESSFLEGFLQSGRREDLRAKSAYLSNLQATFDGCHCPKRGGSLKNPSGPRCPPPRDEGSF